VTIKTSRRARVHEDRAGDPLAGLVNLFDLGIVLAVAFLLAALSSLNLTGALAHHPRTTQPAQPPITINNNQTVQNLNLKPNQRVVGHGVPVGTVYRLGNGQLVYVSPSTTSPSTTSPSTTSPTTAAPATPSPTTTDSAGGGRS
jgi:hypothetical protein